jgi:RND family efflux transporter MFP subunit
MLNRLISVVLKVIFLIHLIGLSSLYASSSPNQILVETQKIQKKELFEVFKSVGQVANVNSKNFFAKVEGTVDFKIDKDGAEVKKGDLLLAINYTIAETLKAKADLNYKISKVKFEKDQKLYKNNIITVDGLNKSQLDFEDAKLNLEKTLETYGNMVIRAPFDGRIGVIKQNLDEYVKTGDFLFTIISPGYKEALISLPQRLFNQINKDTKVYLIDDYKNKYPAKITSISPYISKETGNFDLKLELEDNNNFLHGAYAEIEVVYNEHEALIVPEAGLLRDEQGSFIYLVKENKASKKYLELGTKTSGLVEVKNQDLTIEDIVVVEGLTKVFDGAEVNIKTSEEKTE